MDDLSHKSGNSNSFDDLADIRIGALIAMTQRVLSNHYSAVLDRLQLTPGQAEILNMITQHDTMTAGILAERYRVKPPVMTAMVDGLVRRELVRRGGDPNDRRRSILTATEKGRQMTLELAIIRDDMQNLLVANLGEQETAQFTLSLKKIIRAVEHTRHHT